MKVIEFKDYTRKRKGRCDMCMEVVEEIHNNRKNGRIYKLEEMKELADKFLTSIKYDGENAVPIIKIAQKSGFKIIWGAIVKNNMSGFVSIDQQILGEYGSKNVIGINSNDELGHQRFVIAHEFAHYLFDYDMTDKPYFDTYIKNSHKTLKEQIANKFAVNLLMPAKNFILRFDDKKVWMITLKIGQNILKYRKELLKSV